jgi:hypothetical protein
MTLLSEIPMAVRAWSACKAAWKWVRNRSGKIAALEHRVSTLEAELADYPAEACPYCGKRAWRLKETVYSDREARREIWACKSCYEEQDKWVPTGIKPTHSGR